MNRVWLLVLAFVGIFAAGAVTGGAIAARSIQRVSQERALEQFAQFHFRKLAEHVTLTQDQKERIRPVMMKAGKDVQEHRREISRLLEKMEADVMAELSPEQRSQYEQMRARTKENERAFQRWVREQRALKGLQTPAANPEKDARDRGP
jgi:NCAIR mutase (PurE)-related protein